MRSDNWSRQSSRLSREHTYDSWSRTVRHRGWGSSDQSRLGWPLQACNGTSCLVIATSWSPKAANYAYSRRSHHSRHRCFSSTACCTCKSQPPSTWGNSGKQRLERRLCGDRLRAMTCGNRSHRGSVSCPCSSRTSSCRCSSR